VDVGALEMKKKKTAKDFSLWLDITGLMLSSTFILALLMH
jgi:hypothetical protein